MLWDVQQGSNASDDGALWQVFSRNISGKLVKAEYFDAIMVETRLWF